MRLCQVDGDLDDSYHGDWCFDATMGSGTQRMQFRVVVEVGWWRDYSCGKHGIPGKGHSSG